MTSTTHSNSLREASLYLSQADPMLAPIIAEAGLSTITPHKNYYQELVESIVSQQLSVKAAATILKRFIGLFDTEGFPTPDQI